MARRDVFSTIRSEGALLPTDFLKRLAEGDPEIPGFSADAYHLPPREKHSEAITRSWNRLLGYWAAFQGAAAGISSEDPAIGLTRDKWLLPLFQELGYGRLPAGKGFEIEGKPYPISHVWQNTPIHLLGRNVDLDRPTKGVAGAARSSPHGLMQEFLNRHEGHLWGLLSNGVKLRVLRDSKSLTRQAYVEFDIAGMMDGQVYSDFAVLWLLCHQSRVEAERAEQCWLEKWAETARRQGTRALDTLRDGVKAAIEALGQGFLAHDANRELIDKLRKGALDKQDYYRQLLRTVYRLIFLFVAEDRDLLLTGAPGSKERERYLKHYSAQRLRTLAERRFGSPHGDLWRGLRLVFGKLSESGCAELGLPALGSFLWSDKATADLDRAELANADLLKATRSLAFMLEGQVRRAIDYRNLGAEELGSVYESLLEFHPEMNVDAPTFELKEAPGHERKTTGSYYTPTSLIECLLDTALDPVLQEAAQQPDPEKAILDLKICDPACGSGHFLIAAAHRLANRLAAVRTKDEEPSPPAVRKALRDIVGRCLYGVDINPMAVELCKVNLWLEALEPGKPLSFLEHHIQRGNSLLGATPALLRKGIPDEAFEPLEGDEKKFCQEFRKRNKKEFKARGSLFPEREPWHRLGDLATALADLDALPDDSAASQRAKQDRWEELIRSNSYEFGRLWADAWCAAFVWKKVNDPNFPYPITEEVFRRIEKNPFSVPDWMRNEIRRLADEYQFLHWHLAFPRVFRVGEGTASDSASGPGWVGGFDVVLGNPPWEQQQVSEQEFFSDRAPDIATAAGAERKRLIETLRGASPALHASFVAAQRRSDGENQLVRDSGRYPLCGRGKLNTYAVFAELNRSLLSAKGRAGFIVPSGIATDDTTKPYFNAIIDEASLSSLWDFHNHDRLFYDVGHRRFKFCLLTLCGSAVTANVGQFAFFLRDPADLREPGRCFELSASDIALLNPNTRTCPIFRTRRDAEITKAIYGRVPVLIDETKGEAGNPWHVEFRQGLFNMTSDSGFFRTAKQLEADGWTLAGGNVYSKDGERFLPLYEAKMVHHFNHRYGDYADKPEDSESTALPDVPDSRLADPRYAPLPRYWVPQAEVEERIRDRWDRGWVLGWRDICRSTDERTVIASVIPRVGVGHTVPLFFTSASAVAVACLYANLCSFVFDYVARQKIGGTHLTYFFLKQLPALAPEVYDKSAPWASNVTIAEWLRARVLELVYTSWDLLPFARDLGHEGPPFRWDWDRRFQLRCELDTAFFLLYGLAEGEVSHILDSFPIVRMADEREFGGEYRTKSTIMRILTEMRDSMDHSRAEPASLDSVPRPAARSDSTVRPAG
jgi:methylase of polypeptide subunit release factors